MARVARGPGPLRDPLPAPFEESTTRFSKLIAIRALRMNNNSAVTRRGEFGDELADAKAGTMDEIYADLDNATPCIFILSKGRTRRACSSNWRSKKTTDCN